MQIFLAYSQKNCLACGDAHWNLALEGTNPRLISDPTLIGCWFRWAPTPCMCTPCFILISKLTQRSPKIWKFEFYSTDTLKKFLLFLLVLSLLQQG